MSAWSMATVSVAGAAIGAAPSPMVECAAEKRAAPIAVLPAAAGFATDDDAETIAAFAAASDAVAGMAAASAASAVMTDSSAETSPSAGSSAGAAGSSAGAAGYSAGCSSFVSSSTGATYGM